VRWILALVGVLLVVGCAAAADAPVSSSPSPSPSLALVREARAALGPPTADLAESLLTVAEQLDTVRHEVPRGETMRAAVDEVRAEVASLRAAADAAAAAAAPLRDAQSRAVRDAAVLVAERADSTRAAARAAEAELGALAALAEVDVALDGAVAAFDVPGSQSERRAALTEQTKTLAALAARAAALAPVPAECGALRDSRIRWAALLRERAQKLAASATGASGQLYDAYREAFAADPYGQDRLALDASDRACWQEHSLVAQAAAGVRADVERLEALLS
jgi:hypothetical protein